MMRVSREREREEREKREREREDMSCCQMMRVSHVPTSVCARKLLVYELLSLISGNMSSSQRKASCTRP
jgi:hypothetical protein